MILETVIIGKVSYIPNQQNLLHDCQVPDRVLDAEDLMVNQGDIILILMQFIF